MNSRNPRKPIAFAICSLIPVIMSIVYTWQYRMKINEEIAKSSAFLIDGADFSPLLDLGKSIAKSTRDFVTFLGSCLLVLIVGIVVFCIFYFVALKGKERYNSERKIYLYIFLALFIVSTLICLLIIGSREWTSALLINISWAMAALLFVVLPSGKRQGEKGNEN